MKFMEHMLLSRVEMVTLQAAISVLSVEDWSIKQLVFTVMCLEVQSTKQALLAVLLVEDTKIKQLVIIVLCLKEKAMKQKVRIPLSLED